MPVRLQEYCVQCPGCLTFETLWFYGDVMVETKKFKQVKGRVYHDCSLTEQPCKLFPKFTEPPEAKKAPLVPRWLAKK